MRSAPAWSTGRRRRPRPARRRARSGCRRATAVGDDDRGHLLGAQEPGGVGQREAGSTVTGGSRMTSETCILRRPHPRYAQARCGGGRRSRSRSWRPPAVTRTTAGWRPGETSRRGWAARAPRLPDSGEPVAGGARLRHQGLQDHHHWRDAMPTPPPTASPTTNPPAAVRRANCSGVALGHRGRRVRPGDHRPGDLPRHVCRDRVHPLGELLLLHDRSVRGVRGPGHHSLQIDEHYPTEWRGPLERIEILMPDDETNLYTFLDTRTPSAWRASHASLPRTARWSTNACDHSFWGQFPRTVHGNCPENGCLSANQTALISKCSGRDFIGGPSQGPLAFASQAITSVGCAKRPFNDPSGGRPLRARS